MVAVYGMVAMAWWFLALATGDRPSDFAIGFWIGVLAASIPFSMWIIVTSVDGSAGWREGAEGEVQTAAALRRLEGRWQIEHNLPFAQGSSEVDVDHVAVGPYGVLVIETKSTSASVDLGADRLPPRVRDAVRQAEGNAGRISAVLAAIPGVPIIPVVIYWGRLVSPAPEGFVRREGAVRLVRGADSKHWASMVGGVERMDTATQDAVMARLQVVADRQRAKSVG